MFPLQGTRVQSLVREIRSHKSHGLKIKNKKLCNIQVKNLTYCNSCNLGEDGLCWGRSYPSPHESHFSYRWSQALGYPGFSSLWKKWNWWVCRWTDGWAEEWRTQACMYGYIYAQIGERMWGREGEWEGHWATRQLIVLSISLYIGDKYIYIYIYQGWGKTSFVLVFWGNRGEKMQWWPFLQKPRVLTYVLGLRLTVWGKLVCYPGKWWNLN